MITTWCSVNSSKINDFMRLRGPPAGLLGCSPMTPRRLVAVLAALACLAVAALWLARGRPAATRSATAPSAPTPGAPLSPPAGAAGAPGGVPPAVPHAAEAGQVKMMVDVQLDKLAVCPGEPLTVRITPIDIGAPVRFSTDTAYGNPMVVVFQGAPGRRLLRVNAGTTDYRFDVREFEIEVRERCTEAGPWLPLRQIPTHTLDLIGYQTDVRGLALPPGTPLRYSWDFGDGQRLDTPVPYVEHSFAARDQASAITSTFVVRLEVTAPGGTVGRAVVATTLDNMYAQNKAEGTLVPLVSGQEARLLDGAFVADCDLRQFEDGDFVIDRVDARLEDCDGKTRGEDRQLPLSALSTTRIPPGASHLRLTLAEPPGTTCRVTFDLHGRSPGGLPVVVPIAAALRGPAPIEITDDVLRQDPGMATRHRQATEAMRLLGKEEVTDDEIDRLIREGKIE